MSRTLAILFLAASVGAAAFTVSAPAQAQIINGGFETGDFSGWSVGGPTGIFDSAFGTPPGGSFHALAVNQSTESASDLETFFGIPAGSLNALAVSTDPIAVNGSGFRQTFNASSGSPLSFRWNFLTDDDTPSVRYNDYAFAVIDGAPIKLADTHSAFTASSTGYASETGYQTFNFVLGSGRDALDRIRCYECER